MIKHFLILLPILALMQLSLIAQNNCNKNLIDAENFYQSGRLYAIPEKLKDCIDNGFNKEEKINAYRLLALTYMNINQEDNAKRAMLELLKLNPDYKVVQGRDPRELYNLYTFFNTDPIYFAGFHFGGNYSLPYVINSRHMSGISEAGNKRYAPSIGLQVGADFTLPIRERLFIKTSLSYASFSYNLRNFYNTNIFETETHTWQVDGREQYHFLGAPIGIIYNVPSKSEKLGFFVGVDITPNILLGSAYTSLTKSIELFATDEVAESRSSTENRALFNLSAGAFIGAELKQGRFYYYAKAGVQSFIFTHTRYQDVQSLFSSDLVMNYGIVEDDFVLQNTYIEIGFKMPFYKFIR